MPKVVLFNKPYDVLTQFRPDGDRLTLSDFIKDKSLRVAGRLDRDSEGLLLLTDDGQLNAQLTDPQHKQEKIYWVQVEGVPSEAQLEQLRHGLLLKDGMTRPARAHLLPEPDLWIRQPSIRVRLSIPTCWLEIAIREGRNRQVRRMTAAIGCPTLRLVRMAIGEYRLDQLQPSESRCIDLITPSRDPNKKPYQPRRSDRSSVAADVSGKSGDVSIVATAGTLDASSRNRSRNKRRISLPITPRGR